MAIINKKIKPFIEDRDSRVGIGLALPVSRDPFTDGYFATTSTTLAAVKNNITNLLSTEQGERIFQPNLGLPLKKYLFAQFTEEVEEDIKEDIVTALRKWLPFVTIETIQVEMKDSEVHRSQNVNTMTGLNELSIKIGFAIKNDPNSSDSIELNLLGGNENTISVE